MAMCVFARLCLCLCACVLAYLSVFAHALSHVCTCVHVSYGLYWLTSLKAGPVLSCLANVGTVYL